jgi:hypothetical protein
MKLIEVIKTYCCISVIITDTNHVKSNEYYVHPDRLYWMLLYDSNFRSVEIYFVYLGIHIELLYYIRNSNSLRIF